jgi:hypothetical protein
MVETMAGLLDLPSELLVSILEACQDMQTVIYLSMISRRLYEIWLHNLDQVAPVVLKRSIADYEDAFALAKAEADVASHSTPSAWLQVLMRHTKMADIMLHKLPKPWPKGAQFDHRKYTSLNASYYMIRHLLLAYDQPQLQPALFDKLEASSLRQVLTHNYICYFMAVNLDYDTRMKLGLPTATPDEHERRTAPERSVSGIWFFVTQSTVEAIEVKKNELSRARRLRLAQIGL